jgi:hypothetical protein
MSNELVMETINKTLDVYAENRLSKLNFKAGDMTDSEMRDEVTKWRTALELKAVLKTAFGQ